MPEETKPEENKIEPKFYAVCGHCNFSNKTNATVEINFKEQCVYYVCPSCKKVSKMLFGAQPKPYPKTTLI